MLKLTLFSVWENCSCLTHKSTFVCVGLGDVLFSVTTFRWLRIKTKPFHG